MGHHGVARGHGVVDGSLHAAREFATVSGSSYAAP